MQKNFSFFCVILLLCFFAVSAQAHHTGSSSTSSFNSSSLYEQLRPPKSNLGLRIIYDHLDDHQGEALSYIFRGSYAFHPRWNIGLDLPLQSLYLKGQSDEHGLGDLNLFVRSLLYKTSENNFFMMSNLSLILPTGEEEKGFGNGKLGLNPSLSLVKHFEKIDLFANVGASFLIGRKGTLLLGSVGFRLPLLKGALPLYLALAWESEHRLSDALFKSASSKGFLSPSFLFELSPNLFAALGTKISVMDTLKLREEIHESNPHLFLSDKEFNINLEFNYSF